MSEPIRFHLDENCDVSLAVELRKHGIDVTTTYDVGLKAATDRKQLEFAEADKRVIVSHDADLVKPHKSGTAHHGIIFCKMNRWTPEQIVDGIMEVCGRFDRNAMIGQLVKLNNLR